MDFQEPKRGRRRRLTLKVALRRGHRHIAIAHPQYLINPVPENVDCVCETSRYYFASGTHHRFCSKRIHGNPKHGRGCKQGLRCAVLARIRSKRLARDLTAGRISYDWVEPAATFYGDVERRRLREA
jgi:hypothetical protein